MIDVTEHQWSFIFYDREPILYLLSRASHGYWPLALALVWMVWGPGTMFFAYLDGQSPRRD